MQNDNNPESSVEEGLTEADYLVSRLIDGPKFWVRGQHYRYIDGVNVPFRYIDEDHWETFEEWKERKANEQ